MTDIEVLAASIDRLAQAVEQYVLGQLDKPYLNNPDPGPLDEPPFPGEYTDTRPPVQQTEVVSAVPPRPSGVCPVHRDAWTKLVPAGISKTSGRTYSAFWCCSGGEDGFCDEKPPRRRAA